MNELTVEIKRILIYTIAWGLFLIVGAFWRGEMTTAYGFAFGTFGSILYLLLMGYRVHRSSTLPPKEAGIYMRLGWLIRLSLIVCILLIALRLPFLNFWAVVVGLFSHHIVTMYSALAFVIKTFLNKKRN